MNSSSASKPDQRPVLTLLGLTRNTDNYGVRVLLSAGVQELARCNPEAEIVILDYGRQPEAWIEPTRTGDREVRLINLRFSWRLYLPNNVFRLLGIVLVSRFLPFSNAFRRRIWGSNPWLREMLRARAHYAISGGDSFSDIYGIRRFLYVALPQILVLLLQRPLVLLPQTYGPFAGWLARGLARYIVRGACTVFSRDQAGVGMIQSLAGSSKLVVHAVPDIGFAMTAEPLNDSILRTISEFRAGRPLVGLNASSLLYMGGYTGDNMFGLREAFPQLIAALVDHLVGALGTQVLLVPHVCGGPQSQEDETRVCKNLELRFRPLHGDRVRYLNEPLNHRQMKSLIGQCDLFIGARMHACIGAVSQCIPSVCLAYSGKFAGVMQPLGAGARVVDLRTAGTAEILRVTTEVFEQRSKLQEELHSAAAKILRQSDRQFTLNPSDGSILAS